LWLVFSVSSVNAGVQALSLLVVEDDERLRDALKLALRDEGYVVEVAPDADSGYEKLSARVPDLVLIDVVLPGRSGLELCRQIRHAHQVPIIIITARDDSHDVVAGLESDADDYVTKPFVFKELAARIRALLRRTRMGEGGVDRLVFGELEVVPDEGASMYLVRGERLIPVTRDLPGPPDLTAIVASLLDGPTDPEMRSQLRTAIPAGTRTLDVEVEGDIAYVDLSREFATVGGQEEILAIAQIVLTLTAVDGVEWVGFLLNGVATNVPLPDGALSEAPVAGRDYLELVGLSSSGKSSIGPV
jgi:CheY-like chemotaxis protein